MRLSGLNCEMASEFAKDLFWDESNAWKDQLYVFANQWRMIDRVLCRTDYVICDSPPILSLFYNRPHSDAFVQLVLEKCSQFDTLLFLLKRAAMLGSDIVVKFLSGI
jgi:cellulose biosynthesis protein BcsQ